MPFLIIFIIIPLIEIWVFMTIGEYIGLGVTLLLAFATAILGGIIIRAQGMATLIKAQGDLEHGQMPMNEIFDGFCLIAAGATLITPGFVTDTIGFLLLIPSVRAKLRKTIKNSAKFSTNMGANQNMRANPNQTETIEVEYERLDD